MINLAYRLRKSLLILNSSGPHWAGAFRDKKPHLRHRSTGCLPGTHLIDNKDLPSNKNSRTSDWDSAFLDRPESGTRATLQSARRNAPVGRTEKMFGKNWKDFFKRIREYAHGLSTGHPTFHTMAAAGKTLRISLNAHDGTCSHAAGNDP
jgi:hypothetical protein